MAKVDSPDNDEPLAGPGENPRLKDTNPDGLYTGLGLRNAIQGDGFLPGYESREEKKHERVKR
jgi:hypothetical protein